MSAVVSAFKSLRGHMGKSSSGDTGMLARDAVPTPQALGSAASHQSSPQRKARLVKPKKTKSTPGNDMIVVKIRAEVRTDQVQTVKKLNLSNVVGRDFAIPVGGLSNSSVVYVVEVTGTQGGAWELQKTFQDFYSLHQRLVQKFPAISRFLKTFPKWRLLAPGINSPQIEYRTKFFQAYLQALLQLKPRLSYVNDFLELHQNYHKLQKRELKIEDFELLKLLGKGSFGKVFLVRVIGSKELYAMKVLRKTEVIKRRQVEHTKTELRVMGAANHPFICTLKYAFTTDTRLFMVSEFCAGGELFFHLKQKRYFSEPMVRFYSAEISMALDYLHRNNTIYRDIKPENVLLDEEGHIKITDFGLSRDNVTDPQGATTFCGTPEYLSPEMLSGRQKGHGYGKSVDWWGLGVLMFEMFYGWPPFYDKNRKMMCRKILKGRLVFKDKTNKISLEAKAVIAGFLERDPEQRLGMRGDGFEELKRQSFYNTIDWQLLYDRKLDPPFKPEIKEATDNFDKDFTDQSARISEHENLEKYPEDEGQDEDNAFDDFNFTRTDPDDFWE